MDPLYQTHQTHDMQLKRQHLMKYERLQKEVFKIK